MRIIFQDNEGEKLFGYRFQHLTRENLKVDAMIVDFFVSMNALNIKVQQLAEEANRKQTNPHDYD